MSFTLVAAACRCSFLLIAIILAMYVFKCIIRPYIAYLKYKNHPKVHVFGKFNLVYGESIMNIRDSKRKKAAYHTYRKGLSKIKNKDIILYFEGYNPIFRMRSPQAIQQLQNLIPDKVDREPELLGFGKFNLKGMEYARSISEQAISRKKTYIRLLALNSPSKHILSILSSLKNNMNTWKVNQEYDCHHEMKMIAMDMIFYIIFGNDLDRLNKDTKPFIRPDNTVQYMKFRQFYDEHSMIYYDCFRHPVSILAPFINHYDLINPFIRARNNRSRFKEFIEHAIAISTDKDSVLYQMIHKEKLSNETIIDDLITIFKSQSETVSHALMSMLYNLKKHSGVYTRLKTEIKSHFDEFPDIADRFSRDNILKLSYLHNVIKECFRYDTPAIESLRYRAYEDINICDVDIPKDSLIHIDIHGLHYNSEQWIEPFKFIPERFDPDSQYFLRPNSDKARSSYAHASFSYGARACPGQTMAMLEIKIIVAYILSNIEYSIDEEIINKDDI